MSPTSAASSFFTAGLGFLCALTVVGKLLNNCHMNKMFVDFDSEYGIATRVGLHCAPNAHKTLGTFPSGTIRFSFGAFKASSDVKDSELQRLLQQADAHQDFSISLEMAADRATQVMNRFLANLSVGQQFLR